MKLALECPTGLLNLVNPLGDFDWISVDQLLVDKTYFDYYKGSPRVAFISTRKAFTLTSIDLESVCMAVELLARSCYIVGPDTFGNLEETLKLYQEWKDYDSMFELIGVLQGSTIEEALRCSEYYGEKVALPFDIAAEPNTSLQVKMENRAKLVEYLKDRKIHLLGLTSMEELGWYRGCSWVVSVNTGLPVRLGLQGRSIIGYGDEKERDSRQYMDMGSTDGPGKFEKVILDNVRKVRKAIDGKVI